MKKLTEEQKRLREKSLADLRGDFPAKKNEKPEQKKRTYGKSSFGRKGYGKS